MAAMHGVELGRSGLMEEDGAVVHRVVGCTA